MRKTKTIIIPEEEGNRDSGKHFLATEMPARQAERWARRAILAILKGNPDIPEDVEHAGMEAIARFGFKAIGGLDPDVVDDLEEELLRCVQVMPDHAKPHTLLPLTDHSVEEPMTYMRLAAEVFELHTGFSVTGSLSKLTSGRRSPA